MDARRRSFPLGLALGAVAVAFWLSAEAREGPGGLDVRRERGLDGPGGTALDLVGIERGYGELERRVRLALERLPQRLGEVRLGGHHAGLPAVRARRTREVALPQAVPDRIRSLALYFVAVPRGGARPAILPRELPAASEVFVLEAATLDDVAALAKALRRRVTLATGEFASALGIGGPDARVTFSPDGRTATVYEEVP